MKKTTRCLLVCCLFTGMLKAGNNVNYKKLQETQNLEQSQSIASKYANQSLDNMIGNYPGSMTYTMDSNAPSAPESVDFVITKSENTYTLNFPKFPVATLITAIVGEEMAPGIIGLVGDLTYSIPMDENVVENGNKSDVTLKPELLIIELIAEGTKFGEVVVEVANPAIAHYDGETGQMNFDLTVSGVTLNDEPVPVGVITLNFIGTKESSNLVTPETGANILVYPSPAKDFVQVVSNLPVLKCSVLNTAGVTVASANGEFTNTKLDVSSLTDGLYFVKIETKEGSTVKKFIKE